MTEEHPIKLSLFNDNELVIPLNKCTLKKLIKKRHRKKKLDLIPDEAVFFTRICINNIPDEQLTRLLDEKQIKINKLIHLIKNLLNGYQIKFSFVYVTNFEITFEDNSENYKDILNKYPPSTLYEIPQVINYDDLDKYCIITWYDMFKKFIKSSINEDIVSKGELLSHVSDVVWHSVGYFNEY